jgi:predicted dehydrogenase
MSARHLASKLGFASCSTDADAVLSAAGSNVAFVATRHDLHAAQGRKALLAGKNLFLEKPAALCEEELGGLLDAWRSSGRIFTVGFNRRFAPLSVEMKAFFAERSAPLVMHYRVNAGPIPPESWVHDPRIGGGRIVGEACHFIDLCAYLAGADPVSVFAQSVDPRGGARADDNVVLSIKFGDGSVATLSYVATGDASAGKERLEVLGDGAEAILEDFRRLELRRGGKVRVVRKASQDKGHDAGVAAFLTAVRDGGEPPIPVATIAAVTRATFAALDSLATGERVDVPTS